MSKATEDEDSRQEATAPPSFSGALEPYIHEETPETQPIERITRSTSNSNKSASITSFFTPLSTKRKASPPPASVSLSKPPNKKRPSSSYAPPSKYAHVTNLLSDSLAPNLITVFIGLNPGIKTAQTGFAYCHPSNLFWRLLYSSGCTPRRCDPSECPNLPRLYALGNTNIVSRATKDGSELSKEEMDEGVGVLEEKARRWRPESVCIVGKSIWESIWRVRHGKKIGKTEFRYGWQDEKENMGIIKGEWEGAKVFVATTTSGLAASMKLAEKEEIWEGLGEWVRQRRNERAISDGGAVKDERDVAQEVDG